MVRASTSSSLPGTLHLPLDAVHCYVDASWMASTGRCGFGWCFKDSDQTLLHQEATMGPTVNSATIAEALALKAALIVATQYGFRKLEGFSDSLSLISLLNTNGVINELKAILNDIRWLSLGFTSISFSFIPRLANVQADALAKRGLASMYSSSV